MSRWCAVCGGRIIEVIPSKRRAYWRHEGYVPHGRKTEAGVHIATPRPLPPGTWVWDDRKQEAVFKPPS